MSKIDNWEHHWQEYERSAARNPAQEFRRRLIMRLLVGKETPRQIVDIGSGTGDLAAMLRGVYPDAELLGLELSLAGIESAERKVPNAVFLQKDLTLAEPPPPKYAGWATHAVCSEVLEHVDDPRTAPRGESRGPRRDIPRAQPFEASLQRMKSSHVSTKPGRLTASQSSRSTSDPNLLVDDDPLNSGRVAAPRRRGLQPYVRPDAQRRSRQEPQLIGRKTMTCN
ncbi:MAG: class I SAM-dependent methyltransferase [Actinobacteria bacterium]|nr:class I SAM-dependent methyltransferase [Actinomycetota bacterium]